MSETSSPDGSTAKGTESVTPLDTTSPAPKSESWVDWQVRINQGLLKLPATMTLSLEDVQNNEGHQATIKLQQDGEPRTDCECGASWTHKASATHVEILSIHKSHLAYFNRPLTTVL